MSDFLLIQSKVELPLPTRTIVHFTQYILKLKENRFSYPQSRGDKLRQLLSNHEIGRQIALTILHPGNKGFVLTVADAVK